MIKAVNKGQDEPEDITNANINELFDSLDKDGYKSLDPEEFEGYDGEKRNFFIFGGMNFNTIFNFVVINNYYG